MVVMTLVHWTLYARMTRRTYWGRILFNDSSFCMVEKFTIVMLMMDNVIDVFLVPECGYFCREP